MAKENYDEVIDQKLSELYEVLKALNTLKEKTAAVRDVVNGLADAGRGRVAEIEEAVGRLGEGIDGRIADVGKSMDAVATRVNSAVENAGKERLESIRITAETFSKSLSDLVQAANEGTLKMSKAVAELRGLPFVEELRSIREDGAKQVAELKAGIESVSGDVKKAQSWIESNRAVQTEAFIRQEKQLKDSISKITSAADQLALQIRESRESLGKEIGEGAQMMLSAITELREKIDESIGRLESSFETALRKVKASVSTSEKKMVEESVATRKRVTVFSVAVLAAIVIVGVLVAPAGIASWKALFR